MAATSSEKPAPVMAGIKMLSSALGLQLLYLVMSYVNGLRESVPALLFEALCLGLIMGGLLYAISAKVAKVRLFIGIIALAGFGFGVGRFTQDYSSENLIFILSFALTAGSLVFLFRKEAQNWFAAASPKNAAPEKAPT